MQPKKKRTLTIEHTVLLCIQRLTIINLKETLVHVRSFNNDLGL